MQNTPELEAVQADAAQLPPPPPPVPEHVPATPPNLISQAPTLPQVVATAPRPAASPTANPFASMDDSWTPTAAPRPVKKNKSGARRGVTWLIVLGLVGGLAYAGITYGSDLMELATGEESIDEPSAPLVFPTPTAVPAPIRTATFTVEQPSALAGPQRYDVTIDFDNGISRVVIDRSDAPDLEVLTVFDGAVIRRVDQAVWYRLNRGTFPVGSEFGRSRWVRTLDELLPPVARLGATIERATESTVGTDATRRLLVSLDPTRITQLATGVPVPDPTSAAPADPAAAAPTPADPAAPAAAEPAAPAAATAGLPAGVTLQPGADGIESLQVELWIDDAGIVRKSVLPPELGGETITVTSVSSDPWSPVFPTEDVIVPLTAAALFELSI